MPKPRKLTHGECIDKFVPLMDELFSEVIALKNRLGPDSPQVDRRAFVRAVFGYVEGSSYFMRQLALIEGARRLSLPEKVVLGEVQYDLSGKREVKERPYYLRLEYGVPFTFASIAKAAKVKVNISYSGKGWNDFRKSIDIRNNLMHPKNRKDIEVSEAEVATVWSGSVWFVLGYLLTFQAMMERSKAIAAKTKAKMDLLGKAIEEYKAKKKLD